ncbi:MAG: HAMP domain-containing protein [SAR324 cluster bacterium]|nr:HAMP domain-containing protein [SAR324 cluster bacterium]
MKFLLTWPREFLFSKVRISIRFQLLIMVTLVVVITGFILGWVLLNRIYGEYYDQTLRNGKLLLNHYTENAKEPLLNDDVLTLNTLLKNAVSIEGLRYAVIIDRNRIIRAKAGMIVEELGAKLPDEEIFKDFKQDGDLEYYIKSLKELPVLAMSQPVKLNKVKIGEIALGLDLLWIHQQIGQYTMELTGIGVLGLCLGALMAFWVAEQFSSPIIKLKKVANRIAHGNYEVEINISGRDEIGSLARSFDQMRQAVQYKIEELQTLNEAYQRFVPEEFLRLLGRESIVNVWLGDCIEMDVTIVFTDIRSFTSMSEGMTPRENFMFLNSYLAMMAPEIHRHHGFIDKYIGDAIMALFPGGADDAVQAVLAMRAALKNWNQHRQNRGLVPVEISTGINSGKLMLGTIGEPQRIEGTVIGDAVNLASRIEGMNRTFHTKILLSEYTYASLTDSAFWLVRSVDKVIVRGKEKPVKLFELFEDDPVDIKKIKIFTLNTYEKAIQLYGEQEFESALQMFEDCNRNCPEDSLFPMYIERCRWLMDHPPGPTWNGVFLH